jgi:hypothetical protein
MARPAQSFADREAEQIAPVQAGPHQNSEQHKQDRRDRDLERAAGGAVEGRQQFACGGAHTGCFSGVQA